MKKDEFIERIREGIINGLWIRKQVDDREFSEDRQTEVWMVGRVKDMLWTMTLIDIIDMDEKRLLERKGGLTAADDQTVFNDDEKATHSSTSILPQEDEDGKH